MEQAKNQEIDENRSLDHREFNLPTYFVFITYIKWEFAIDVVNSKFP